MQATEIGCIGFGRSGGDTCAALWDACADEEKRKGDDDDDELLYRKTVAKKTKVKKVAQSYIRPQSPTDDVC